MPLNVYKTNETLDAYSKNGAFTDPILDAQSYRFDGADGQTRDVPLFLKNDGTIEVQNIVITPIDNSGADESTWVKLAVTLVGLDTAIAGDPVISPNLDVGMTFAFWARITVPPSTTEELKQDISLKLEGSVIVVS
jgi:hypothetical protein